MSGTLPEPCSSAPPTDILYRRYPRVLLVCTAVAALVAALLPPASGWTDTSAWVTHATWAHAAALGRRPVIAPGFHPDIAPQWPSLEIPTPKQQFDWRLSTPLSGVTPSMDATVPPGAAPPKWASSVNPLGFLLLSILALWRMLRYSSALGGCLAGLNVDSSGALQLRASSGMRRGSGYGQRKPSVWKVLLDKAKGICNWFVNTASALGRWVINNPIDVIMLLIFLCSWYLWMHPSIEYLFLVQGFRNPLAFVLSGFSCFNIYQLYSDIFYVYILGKAYCVEFSANDLRLLYVGGTVAGSLLVALTPGGWMGPTAGTAALLTSFMLRYPGTPMAIPMIPLIFFPFQVRWIGTILAVANFYLFTKGVASGAAFTGGVLFALLLKNRKQLEVQEVSLTV